MNDVVKTPCVGVCSTGIAGDVCRGCKRYLHEVRDWNGYSLSEKRSVVNRLDQFLDLVISSRFDVFDLPCLLEKLRANGVRFDASRSFGHCLHQLLRAGASQIVDSQEYGFRVQQNLYKSTLGELAEEVDQEYFLLSELHYERYFCLGGMLKAELAD